MQFESVSFMSRLNRGNYEHDELSVSAKVEDGENIRNVIFEIKQVVYESLKGSVSTPSEKAPKVTKTVEPKVEEPKVEVQTELPLAPAEEKLEEPKAEKKAKVKTEPKAKTVKAPKTTVYDRELDTHKNLIGKWLDSSFRGWNDKSTISKFGAASRALSGKAEFLDESGEILESFKAEFSKLVQE